MKVIFVGMHNKPFKLPLCSSTKSGKLINKIIDKIQPLEHFKTNLYDVDVYPIEDVKRSLALEWHNRAKPMDGDIIVLLGAEVRNNFVVNKDTNYKYVMVAHPSSKRSHIDMNEYVEKTAQKINFIYKQFKTK